ncbi:MAG: hypothetical protein L0H63_10055, partial [Nitrococcus sp.]|nr:hypothetical protein [Nitrococcus sp.]
LRLLFVTRSGILAHSFPVATTKGTVTVNQDLKAIIPDPAGDLEYLAWCLRANARTILDECTKDGTTVHSIEVSLLRSFLVPLAPPAEQLRIVAKLKELFSELDKGIESLKAAREQLKVYRQAVLRHPFEGKLTAQWREENKDKLETAEQVLARINGEGSSKVSPCADSGLPALPRGWLWLRYGELCSLVRNGVSKKPDGDAGTKIFRISAVRPMQFDLTDVRYIDNENGVFDQYYLQYGDIVFARCNGSRAYVGIAAEYRSDGTHLYPDKLIRTRLSGASVLPSYIEKAVNCGQSRKFMERRIRTTAGQSGVSGTDIKAMPVPICSTAEQAVISAQLNEYLTRIDHVLAEIDQNLLRSESLRQSILKEAFSGQLVPQDPKDEPASVLLERIRPEKASQAKFRRTRSKGTSKPCNEVQSSNA